MKVIKIVLPIVVVAILGFFTYNSFINIEGANKSPVSNNSKFVNFIEVDIDSLSNYSKKVFAKEFYKDIQFKINDFYEEKHFGKNLKDNEQWRDILSKNLYTAYTLKFVEQAMFVFNGSKWNNTDLKFIESEIYELRDSPYLDASSPVAQNFKEIDEILKKYKEISYFIYTTNNFSYSNYDLNVSFPDLSDKIRRSRNYLANGLDNEYVNNCTRLKNGLRQIPTNLFNKHEQYVTRKINLNIEKYFDCEDHRDYDYRYFSKLNKEIKNLSNNIYGVSTSTMNKPIDKMNSILRRDNRAAFDYFLEIGL